MTMQKMLLVAVMAMLHCSLFAQQNAGGEGKQYMLIVRYRMDVPAPDAETMKANGQHWGEFIGKLAQSGKLVSGLRPEQAGRTISGKDKTVQESAYMGDKAVVSSFFVIKAADLDEATTIAKQCPIYELGGSVEIRGIMNMAN
jgi:hypothetical protein